MRWLIVADRFLSCQSGNAHEDTTLLAADLPDHKLAYFDEGSKHFDDHVEAVGWAQDFARRNREVNPRIRGATAPPTRA